MRLGAKVVKKVMSSKENVHGLTTAELFQRAQKLKAPPKFIPYEIPPEAHPTYGKIGNLRQQPPVPPHPNHPVQSLKCVIIPSSRRGMYLHGCHSFLKNTILPMLANKKRITQVQATRLVSPRSTVHVPLWKGKDKAKEFVAATDDVEGAIPVKVWVWKKVDPRTLPSRKPPPPKPIYGTAVGAGEDWSHLNKRRQRARITKVRRDVMVLRDADRQKKLEERLLEEERLQAAEAARQAESEARSEAKKKARFAAYIERRKAAAAALESVDVTNGTAQVDQAL